MLQREAVQARIICKLLGLLMSFCRIVGMTALLSTAAGVASAQEPTAALGTTSEEIEPRIVGTTGTTMIGVSGFIDRSASARTVFPTNFILQGDVMRFVNSRIAISGGLAGVGSVGEGSDMQDSGAGALALHAFGGGLYFLTPQSLASLYFGGSYWSQVTRRDGPDAGSLVGNVGLHAAMSSRSAFYLEGGYGVSLTKGSKGETISRILGRVGVRLRL